MPWGALLVTGLHLDFVPLITTFWAQLFIRFLVLPILSIPISSIQNLGTEELPTKMTLKTANLAFDD